tara:strand:- start:556 stop:780 length:225 start_codon:yes stop_codon:yes gene_type:complete
MILEAHPSVAALPNSEKVALINELWDEILGEGTDSQRHREIAKELELAAAEYEKDPADLVSWAEVKERAQAGKE